MDPVRRARAYLSRVGEPGDVAVWALVEAVGPVAAAEAVRRGEPPIGDLPAVQARRARVDVEDDLDSAQRHGIRLLIPEDPDWPHFALATMYHATAPGAALRRGDSRRRAGREASPDLVANAAPPLALWVKGPLDTAALAARSISVVGARAATQYGTHVAADLAYELARRGVTVVSGGAFGIDATAHRAALAADGDTILVSAGGLDRPYPAAHGALYEQVAQRGLLISESPPGGAPFRRRFLSRNRLIAAFGSGTVVVEAGRRSGALNTAAHARRLGRPLMAVPGPVTSAMSVGCHDLLRREPSDQAMPARLVTSVEDVLAELAPDGGAGAEIAPGRSDGGSGGPQGAADAGWRGHVDALSEPDGAVYDALRPRAWATADELAVRSGVPLIVVRQAMATLEVGGLAQSGPLGYRLAPRARAGMGAGPPMPPP